MSKIRKTKWFKSGYTWLKNMNHKWLASFFWYTFSTKDVLRFNTHPCDWGPIQTHPHLYILSSAMFFSNMFLWHWRWTAAMWAVRFSFMTLWPWIKSIQWLPAMFCCCWIAFFFFFNFLCSLMHGAKERLHVWPWRQTWSETSVNMALCTLSFVHHGCLPPCLQRHANDSYANEHHSELLATAGRGNCNSSYTFWSTGISYSLSCCLPSLLSRALISVGLFEERLQHSSWSNIRKWRVNLAIRRKNRHNFLFF